MRVATPLLLLLLLLLAPALAGCAAPARWYAAARDRLEDPLGARDPEVWTRPALVAEGVDEPALAITLGRRRAVATLMQAQGERRLWRTPDGVAVATAGARVVATAGLSEMLAATRLDGPDPLDDPAALVGREVALRRQVDLMRAGRGPEGMRFGLQLSCRLRAGAPQGLPAAAAADLIEVRERCAGGGVSFTNRYWAEAEGGAVVRSEQWVGERLPPMVVEPMAAEPPGAAAEAPDAP